MTQRHQPKRHIFTTALLLSGMGQFAQPAFAGEATATASAAILSPATVNKVDDLAFGKVVAGPSAANVTISPTGAFRCGAGLTCLDTHNPARFTVIGAPGQMVSIDADDQVTLTAANGAKMVATLDLGARTMRLAQGSNLANVFAVGGTLAVGAYQAEGVYTGVFTVTVDYN